MRDALGLKLPTLSPSIREKMERGDALTDAELENAASFYKLCTTILGDLGPEFRLARNECFRRLDSLETIIFARETDKAREQQEPS
jgi:hypothetical protein